MKQKTRAFSFVEVVVALAILGLAGMVVFGSLSLAVAARGRNDTNREVGAWHVNYALTLARGDIDRAATSSTSPISQTITLPSGLSVSLTDTFAAPETQFPRLLYITSVATWTLPQGGTGQSTYVVARPVQFTTN